MVSILDNAMPKHLFDELKEMVFSNQFPWYFHTGTAYSNSIDLDEFCLIHKIIDNDVYLSNLSTKFVEVFTGCLEKLYGIPKIYKFHRIQINCTTFRNNQKLFLPHVDMMKNHKVGIFYLNTCKGDTLVFKEKYNIRSTAGSKKYGEKKYKNNFTKQESITPVENRLAVFDGLNYHGGFFPLNVKQRIIINLNFTELN